MTAGWCNKPGLQLERFPPPAGLEPGTAISAGQHFTQKTHDVVLTSMHRRQYDVMCLLGTYPSRHKI